MLVFSIHVHLSGGNDHQVAVEGTRFDCWGASFLFCFLWGGAVPSPPSLEESRQECFYYFVLFIHLFVLNSDAVITLN